MPNWIWLPELLRYRNLDTGVFVSSETVRGWAFDSIAASGNAAQEAASMLADSLLNLPDWEQVMRDELKGEYIRQYILGKGGLEQMTQADWGSIGGMLGDQYRYLDGFAQQIADGTLTEAQIAARSEMYFASSTEAYERAHARAMGAPELPAYPGDGTSECMTNCRCAWDLNEVEPGVWECTWQIDAAAESCGTCIERSRDWAPLVIRTEEAE